MKRLMLSLIAGLMVTMSVGCASVDRGCHGGLFHGCFGGCREGHCHRGLLHHGHRSRESCRDTGDGSYGPTAPHVAYPYYTLRGPRDFLLDNPPSIGP